MIKHFINDALTRANLRVVPAAAKLYGCPIQNELESSFLAAYEKCLSFSLTSVERLYAAYQAAGFVAKRRLPGAIVECGVWKGGSTMIMLHALLELGVRDRDIYLYDTYEGMSEPTDKDRSISGISANERWSERQRGSINTWCYSPIEEVRENVLSTGYPAERLHFVKGKVENTIPGTVPNSIAVLRLDTDWFESTYHELTHLYPRLVTNGVLIIDDYGTWQGAREATDQYFRESEQDLLLSRIDYTGRIAIKI